MENNRGKGRLLKVDPKNLGKCPRKDGGKLSSLFMYTIQSLSPKEMFHNAITFISCDVCGQRYVLRHN